MRIVIIGAGGRLGSALVRAYRDQFEMLAFDHEQLDLGDENQITDWLTPLDFDVLINAAAMTNVDRCEAERDLAFRINAEAPRLLAAICSEKGAKLIHFSTDYVFDGRKRGPYTEEDPANPISVYGQSKHMGEEHVSNANPRHLVVRVSWVFGPGRPSFVDTMIERARTEEQIQAIGDKFSAPTYTHDIAGMLPQFFPSGDGAGPLQRPGTPQRGAPAGGLPADYGGILHFANAGQCSWQEYARYALDCCHRAGVPLKAKTVGALKLAEMRNWTARRPVYSVLSTGKYTALTGRTPRTWRDAVSDYIEHFYSIK
jgi:dTDP-4-dehydrorhamnose reductase